ncbi:hypothetical protein GCM10009789_53850 [Kribbella sancticallisti]|uniref:DUF1707 domain-containing protein n=1 Tax=Kribbella sancticallisti TaxID=460087 RepID=A0ABN2E117_9ACTN
MSQHLPDRTGPLRIGDAERDQAVAVLSEHFVAGRLTQDEFEERSDQATRARYTDDLTALFVDLPDKAVAQATPAAWSPAARSGPPRRRTGPPPIMFLAPVLMIGLVIAAVSFAAPWILWMFFWIALFSGPHHHHRRHHPGRR